jgi:hypothetical protein
MVERSDTTGKLLPPPLHPEGVPATYLIRPARLYFGVLKSNKTKSEPVISLGSNDQQSTSLTSAPTNQTPKLF